MKSKQAFTLIELLVVVLIIGILTVVALPQYKMAVAKARLTQLITLTKTAAHAQEIYYLANGTYASDISELDLDWQGTVAQSYIVNPAGWTLSLGNGSSTNYVTSFDSRLPDIAITLFLANYPQEDLRSTWGCYAAIENTFANTLCKNVTHRTTRSGTTGTHYYYMMFEQ